MHLLLGCQRGRAVSTGAARPEAGLIGSAGLGLRWDQSHKTPCRGARERAVSLCPPPATQTQPKRWGRGTERQAGGTKTPFLPGVSTPGQCEPQDRGDLPPAQGHRPGYAPSSPPSSSQRREPVATRRRCPAGAQPPEHDGVSRGLGRRWGWLRARRGIRGVSAAAGQHGAGRGSSPRTRGRRRRVQAGREEGPGLGKLRPEPPFGSRGGAAQLGAAGGGCAHPALLQTTTSRSAPPDPGSLTPGTEWHPPEHAASARPGAGVLGRAPRGAPGSWGPS